MNHPKNSKCPRCSNVMYDDEVLNALSRRDNKTYICSDCGTEEALIDAGILPESTIELDFIYELAHQ